MIFVGFMSAFRYSWEMTMLEHELYMRIALEEAQKAYAIEEVPIGAILVNELGDVIGRGFNQCIVLSDPTAHAEIQALRHATQQENNYRLPKTTLYVTLEPCMMCLGAIFQARVSSVFFGAYEPKTGVCGSKLSLHESALNHHAQVHGGVLEQDCALLLKRFFHSRRAKH